VRTSNAIDFQRALCHDGSGCAEFVRARAAGSGYAKVHLEVKVNGDRAGARESLLFRSEGLGRVLVECEHKAAVKDADNGPRLWGYDGSLETGF